jgi:hypothetical protein
MTGEQENTSDIPDLGSAADEIAAAASAAPSAPPAPPSPQLASLLIYNHMQREIRSWGWWLLALGVIHLVVNGFLSAPWGVLLVLVGASSFYFREAPMFVIYGFTLLWAALSNFLGGEITWIFLSLFQIYLAIRIFVQFFRFRRAQASLDATLDSQAQLLKAQRAATIFPWTGCLFSALAGIGVPAFFAYATLVSQESQPVSGNAAALWIGFLLDFAVLGFSLSLAALLSGFRYRVISILGLIASGLLLIGWVVLVVTG